MKGRALYYSDALEGNRMACGERYDPSDMIAASRHLPCNARVRVTNVANGKSRIVTIEDRGPFGDRETILDLSRSAARELEFISAGSAQVTAVPLHDD